MPTLNDLVATEADLRRAEVEIERLRALNSEILEARQSALNEVFRLKLENDRLRDLLLRHHENLPLCWENGPLTIDGVPSHCTLPDGHHGPHEWTQDDKIFIRLHHH